MKLVSRLLAGLALLVLLLALVLWLFPWDVLRGPVNRYVSEKTGRHFEVTRRLDVKLGRVTRVIMDGVRFANPDWAKDPQLVTADAAEVDVRLLPLLHRRIELPRIALVKPQLGLEMLPDGRRTWAFGGKDTGNPHNVPAIGTLEVDQGRAHFLVPAHAADIQVDFALAGTGPLPLAFQAQGRWEAARFDAQGRTASVLSLERQQQDTPMPPFPVQLQATAGQTRLTAQGQIASLSTLEGASLRFDLQGRNLADLYHLLGVVLPETPRFAVSGEVRKAGEVWQARHVQGRLGVSDIGGDLDFDRSGKVPLLHGTLASRSLDFDDLAPLVGLPEQPRSAGAGAGDSAKAEGKGKGKASARTRAARDPNRKVMPDRPIDLARLKAMDADVRYVAQRISHVRALPLDRMSTHVVLRGGVLQLDPLEVGVAGGTIGGRVRIDGEHDPASVRLALDARSLQLARLFPGVKLTKESLGALQGDIDLQGRGNSVAQMLGSSNGKVGFVMGSGRISNLVMEIAGLDGGEILKFLATGDRQIPLRCAAASFDVTHGLMKSRALMLDTTDTIVYGDGSIDLGKESLDLVMRAYPKDMSLLAFRTPLKLTGTFAAPHPGVEAGPLAAKAGLALALGAVNPLLALAATVETGPGRGHDANCGAVLREAASPEATARIEAMEHLQQKRHGTALGAGPAAGARRAAPARPSAQHQPGGTDQPHGSSARGGTASPADPAKPVEPAPSAEPAGGMWNRG
ncbi:MULTISPECIES: AsmA family protein [Ramlibacter]|uniref:AsmA family protein n=1 Tax=Ramlibacter aquaticus TaxID=2780094 RepID=A0ABR9SGB7_9BURK|nr:MULTISPECIES: AsmA family protein [Ramlibacter]MBE7941386.1 AsmA family protein [Ramlibacter aquaticus]